MHYIKLLSESMFSTKVNSYFAKIFCIIVHVNSTNKAYIIAMFSLYFYFTLHFLDIFMKIMFRKYLLLLTNDDKSLLKSILLGWKQCRSQCCY